MQDRTKSILFIAAGILCIASAWGLVFVFSGSWRNMKSGPVNIAGPLLTYVPELRRQQAQEQTQADVTVSEAPVPPAEGKAYAYISGAVKNPGVYEITPGDRVFVLVEAAGGLREDADTSLINLAAPLEDAAHIHVRAVGETSTAVGSREDFASDAGQQHP